MISHKTTIFSIFLLKSISASTSTFYALNSDGTCNQPEILTTSDNAFSVLSSKNNILPDNVDCNINFIGPTNSQFLINFQRIGLEIRGNNTENPCRDYLEFTVNNDTKSDPSGNWEVTTHSDQNEYQFLNTKRVQDLIFNRQGFQPLDWKFLTRFL